MSVGSRLINKFKMTRIQAVTQATQCVGGGAALFIISRRSSDGRTTADEGEEEEEEEDVGGGQTCCVTGVGDTCALEVVQKWGWEICAKKKKGKRG